MENPEQEVRRDDTEEARNAAAARLLRDAALAIGRNDHALALRSVQFDSVQLSVRNDEQVTEMASRLLLSGAAGYTTRIGCFTSGLSRIPRLGPLATLVAPFVVSGITSSYMKTGELTDSRSLLEGGVSYGLLGQGFKLASQDTKHFATQALVRKYELMETSCISVDIQALRQAGVPINSKSGAFPSAATPRRGAAIRASLENHKPVDNTFKLRIEK